MHIHSARRLYTDSAAPPRRSCFVTKLPRSNGVLFIPVRAGSSAAGVRVIRHFFLRWGSSVSSNRARMRSPMMGRNCSSV